MRLLLSLVLALFTVSIFAANQCATCLDKNLTVRKSLNEPISAPTTEADKSYHVVDVMVVVTKELADAAGGNSVVQNHAARVLDYANTVFYNSRVNNVRLRLVLMVLADYKETGDSLLDLSVLITNKDLHDIQNSCGADLVCMFVSKLEPWVGGRSRFLSQGGQYSVVLAGDAEVFTHEVGHNFGCGHETLEAGPAYDYSHAINFTFNLPEGNFDVGTIMASDGARLPLFSNPDLIIENAAKQRFYAGIYGKSDNARTLRNTARVVANHKKQMSLPIYNLQRKDDTFSALYFGFDETVHNIESSEDLKNWRVSSSTDTNAISAQKFYRVRVK